jgi:hypothetical protein
MGLTEGGWKWMITEKIGILYGEPGNPGTRGILGACPDFHAARKTTRARPRRDRSEATVRISRILRPIGSGASHSSARGVAHSVSRAERTHCAVRAPARAT